MLMAVHMTAGATFDAATPRPLFAAPPVGVLRYDVAPDDARLFVNTPVDQAPSAPAIVVLNLFGELRARAAAKAARQ
jgi:hypothetical protein